jgi:hypothetical protein
VKENIGEIFHGISLGNNFLLDMSWKAEPKEIKIDKCDQIKLNLL